MHSLARPLALSLSLFMAGQVYGLATYNTLVLDGTKMYKLDNMVECKKLILKNSPTVMALDESFRVLEPSTVQIKAEEIVLDTDPVEIKLASTLFLYAIPFAF